MKEHVFPKMVESVLDPESFEHVALLSNGFFLVTSKKCPTLSILRVAYGEKTFAVAAFYKYLEGIHFFGGYFPLFSESSDSPRHLKQGFEDFIQHQLTPEFWRFVAPKRIRVKFFPVKPYGVDQPISFERASKIFFDLPVFPGVYTVDNPYVSPLLETALPRLHFSDRILILGTGAGIEATYLATVLRRQIDAIDINCMAVANTKASAFKTNTDRYVRVWQSDGFDRVLKRYDKILFNAPFPALEGHSRNDYNLEDENGKTLRKIFDQLPYHLTKNGELLLMTTPNLDDFLTPDVTSELLCTFSVQERTFAIQSVTLRKR